MITVYRKVVVVTRVFLLIIHVEFGKIVSHFIKILFHLLFVITWRDILSRLIKTLGCLPSKIRTFWRQLSKLLSKILSFVIFLTETSMISFWCLLRSKEILLWPWWLNVHFIGNTLWHIYWLIIILSCLLLLSNKIIWSRRRVVSSHTELIKYLLLILVNKWIFRSLLRHLHLLNWLKTFIRCFILEGRSLKCFSKSIFQY